MGSNPTPSAHSGDGAADVDIRTERLLLRRWRESDREPWTAMGADARVMRHFPPANERSRRVMERIGMTRDRDGDFDHPRVPEGHPLRRHVHYRLRPGSPRFVADPRHRFSYELRPDAQLDGRLRAIAADLEARGLIDAGASTAPRFHPHLTMCRAAVECPAAVAAAAAVIASRGAAVCLDHAGVFGDGRIVWLGPAAPDALEAARSELLAQLDPHDVDPLAMTRPWTPHVTIAYAVPEPAQAEALSVVAAQLPLTGTWRCVQSWDLDVRPTLLATERSCVDASAAG